MNARTQVMIGSEDLAVRGQLSNLLKAKGLGLSTFRSVKQARQALSRDNVLVVFCENQLVDGTYEDLLIAARQARSRARIVVTSSKSNHSELSTYVRAKELGAFDVLRESYGPKDVEWVVICALREEEQEAVRVGANLSLGAIPREARPARLPLDDKEV